MSTACVQQGLYFQFLPIFRSKKDPGEIPLRVLLVLHQLFFNFFFCFRFNFRPVSYTHLTLPTKLEV